MERKIFLVRHAGAMWFDKQKCYLGQSDPVLSAVGIRQAKRLARAFKYCPIQAVFTSDLLRAEHTARWISQNHRCEPEKVRELREINLGKWEGRTFREVQAQYPEEYEKRALDLENYRIAGGESFADLRARVIPWFTKAVAKMKGNLVIVTHAGVNRVILCHLTKLSIRELFSIPQEYAAVNIIQEHMGCYRVAAVNKNLADTQAKGDEGKWIQERV